ncbi:cache domain-containing protein [Helicobacter baculiformis]|uniref:Cache domain-containing protein n=1 Tax=Helicobacter baculiformis TaxID=427351 RepID=A0ABV7ZLL4_9HELI|nr:methyl-accepting chemotaxis protein [Helicobacter baculiformis]
MGFKTKILLVLAGLLVITFASIIAIINASASSSITKTIQHSLNTAVTLISSSLVEWNNNIRMGLVNTAKDLELQDFKDIARITQILQFVHDGMVTENTYVGFEDGRVVGTMSNIPKDYDPRKRKWYQATQQSNTMVISNPYKDIFTGKWILTYSVPLSKNGVFQGVLALDISLDSFGHNEKKFYFDGGRIHILDRDAFVLRSPIFEQGSNYRDSHSYTGGKELTDQIFSTTSGFLEHRAVGIDKFFVYTTVPGLGWKVLGVINKKDAFRNLRNLQSTLLIIAISSILFVLAVLFGVIQFLFKPLIKLRDLIIELVSEEGDLTKRLAVKGKDEIAIISKNINAFLGKTQGIISQIKEISSENTKIASALHKSSDNVQRHTQEETKRIALAVNNGNHIVSSILPVRATPTLTTSILCKRGIL